VNQQRRPLLTAAAAIAQAAAAIAAGQRLFIIPSQLQLVLQISTV
jgi:hypothetical protein